MKQLLIVYATYCIIAAVAFLLAYWFHRSSEHRKVSDDARRAEDATADTQMQMTVELSKPCYRRDREWWQNWCKANDLPESTTRTLMAGVRDKQ